MTDLTFKNDELTSAELDRVPGGYDDASGLSMITLESSASQRQTAMQMTADVLRSSSDTAKRIINHIH